MVKVINLQDSALDFSSLPPCSAALGNFDGVHIAHTRLIQRAVETASEKDISSAVFTFFSAKGEYITSFEEKVELFGKLGIEYVFASDFDVIREQSPEEFFHQILLKKMHIRSAVCGFNFRFGRQASGDAQLLQHFCRQEDIDCFVFQSISEEEGIVSSTRIREAIRSGKMELVRSLLGRPFTYSGIVSHGRSVGGEMKVPTLNLSLPTGKVKPPYGVYFTTCRIDGEQFSSVSNVGIRPTYDRLMGKSDPICETHILSSVGDLYGKKVCVELDHFQREERQFQSPKELYHQIALDREAAMRYYHVH
jgi:riboflavin kinase/FMN adenylyltransferase